MIRARSAIIGLALISTGFVLQTTDSGNPVQWRDGCPLLEIGDVAAGGPDATQLHDVIAASIAEWEADCDELPFAVANATVPLREVGFDGRNLVVTRAADYCDDPANVEADVCLNPDALAITTTYYIDAPGEPQDGELLEVDLEINLSHDFGLGGELDKFDLQSTVTHELGHILGLEHACTPDGDSQLVDPAGHLVPACTSGKLTDTIRAATMYPYGERGKLARRTPEPDERRAMCLVYRNHPGTCAQEPLAAGCTCASDRFDASSLLILGAIVMLRGRRRR